MNAIELDNPLLNDLGIVLTEAEVGRCTFQLRVENRHLNRQGSLHGGVVATLLDAACGYSGVRVDAESAPGHAVTVMLTISYTGRTSGGVVTAKGWVTAAGRSIYFGAAELLADDGRILATAQGTFKRSRPRGEPEAGSRV